MSSVTIRTGETGQISRIWTDFVILIFLDILNKHNELHLSAKFEKSKFIIFGDNEIKQNHGMPENRDCCYFGHDELTKVLRLVCYGLNSTRLKPPCFDLNGLHIE